MEEHLAPNWDPPGEAWPLLFSYAKLVDAEAFRAKVEISGAILAVIDPADGRCWLDGVYPGGTAAGGTSVDDAYANFREFIGGILDDMADDCGTREAFEEWLRVFVTSTDDLTLAGWKDGVSKVRSNAPGSPPNLERRDSEGWVPGFSIHEVGTVVPSHSSSTSAQIAA